MKINIKHSDMDLIPLALSCSKVPWVQGTLVKIKQRAIYCD